MSDFYKKFLLEDVRKLGTNSSRQIFLAAFGKHPGWDDHVEDLGLDTESLIFAKTVLYVQGIGGEIDSGAWEKLEPGQQAPAFKHLFVWQRAGQFLIGRMWASSDGKGRTRYPMVVCAHCAGVSLGWALNLVLPRLEEVEHACLQTKSAADVRAILARARAEFQNACVSASTNTTRSTVSLEALEKFIASAELGPHHEGWLRILYQMQGQMSAFAPGRFNAKGDLSGLRPQQVRVPKCGHSPLPSVQLWTEFFLTQVDAAAPLLLTVPLEESWLDATVGEPTPHEFFCLRANPKALPLVNEVPYNLDEAFRNQARKFLAGFQHGQNPRGAIIPSAPVTAASPANQPSTTKKLLRWFAGGAALVLLAVAAVIFISSRNAKVVQTKPVQPPGVVASVSPAAADQANAAEKAKVEAVQRQRLAAEAEARRVAEAARLAQEKANADAVAKQTARALAESESKRLAEEKARREALAREAAQRQAEAEAQEKIRVAVVHPVEPIGIVKAATGSATAESATKADAARRLFTNGIGMILVLLPGEYWVGKYEVTQSEYERVMGANPSRYRGPRQPVDSVSWNEAVEFCRKLTDLEKPAGTTPAGTVYTLPTQKQWEEFLADAKFQDAVTSRSAFRESTAPAGSTGVANKYGLFDVVGNVWEWCLDGASPPEKALRGGAYNSLKTENFKPLTEVSARMRSPDAKSLDAGFRCVLVKQ